MSCNAHHVTFSHHPLHLLVTWFASPHLVPGLSSDHVPYLCGGHTVPDGAHDTLPMKFFHSIANLVCLMLQINHNQSLEVALPDTPAFAGNQAGSRRRLLASLYEDNIANDQNYDHIQRHYSLPNRRSMRVNQSQAIDGIGSAAITIDNAARSANNAIDNLLHHGIHSSSSQNYSSIDGAGLWYGYNVSYMPHETLHQHYNLPHDDSDQTVTAELWYGYDVQYRPQQSVSQCGNFTPRYLAGRNQVLGGLYFQQVS